MTIAVDPSTPQGEERPGSNRNFGFVFAGVFGLIAIWPLINGHGPRWIALGIAAAFALVAGFSPKILRPLNFVWFKFGLLLHRVVSPIVMGAVFFLCILPIGILMRLFGEGSNGAR